jgi:methylated-DNA-[protein]-cysteine S-methyltransferase
MEIFYYQSPLGWIELRFDSDDVLTHLYFHKEAPPNDSILVATRPNAKRVVKQLDQYFTGNLERFDTPLRVDGTEFQKRVWHELQTIPYGVTISYRELTERCGFKATAIRAVGGANGSNPISIIIPCHRVIGANGDLTGYGGGLERKRALLELEGAILF